MNRKYYIEKSEVINSTPEYIFSILKDVEHWNNWTDSIIHISFKEGKIFEIGSRVKILQPKLSPAIWTITEIHNNKSFSWEQKSYGTKIIANHFIEKCNEGTIAKSQIIFQGFWAWLIYKLSFALTTRYLEMEIKGLKNKCESLE